jgi:hypothetical protein
MGEFTELEKSIRVGIDRIIEGDNTCRLVAALIQKLPKSELAIFEFLEVNLIRGELHLFERFGYKHGSWWTLRDVEIIHRAGVEVAEQVLKAQIPADLKLYEGNRDWESYNNLIDARFNIGFLEEIQEIRIAFDRIIG